MFEGYVTIDKIKYYVNAEYSWVDGEWEVKLLNVYEGESEEDIVNKLPQELEEKIKNEVDEILIYRSYCQGY